MDIQELKLLEETKPVIKIPIELYTDSTISARGHLVLDDKTLLDLIERVEQVRHIPAAVTSTVKKKVYIVAGLYTIIELCAKNHGLKEADFVYITKAEDLCGIDDVEILVHDTAPLHPNFEEIFAAIHQRNNIKLNFIGDKI